MALRWCLAGPGTLLFKAASCSADLDESDSGGSVQEANPVGILRGQLSGPKLDNQRVVWFPRNLDGARCAVQPEPPLTPPVPSADAVILLWKVNDNKEPEQITFQDEDEAELNTENWTVVKTLR